MTQAGHVTAGGRRGACHPVAGGCSGHRELQLLAPGSRPNPVPPALTCSLAMASRASQAFCPTCPEQTKDRDAETPSWKVKSRPLHPPISPEAPSSPWG